MWTYHYGYQKNGSGRNISHNNHISFSAPRDPGYVDHTKGLIDAEDKGSAKYPYSGDDESSTAALRGKGS